MAKYIDPMAELKAFIARCGGSQTKAAAALRISNAYLSDILHHKRGFSDAVLAKLGLERFETVVRK